MSIDDTLFKIVCQKEGTEIKKSLADFLCTAMTEMVELYPASTSQNQTLVKRLG